MPNDTWGDIRKERDLATGSRTVSVIALSTRPIVSASVNQKEWDHKGQISTQKTLLLELKKAPLLLFQN